MKLYKVGSNQYKARPRDFVRPQTTRRTTSRVFGLKTTTWRDINIVSVAILMVGYFGHQNALKDLDLHRHLISPLSMTAYAQEAPTYKVPELAPMAERQRNILLIRRYFGSDAGTAIKVFTCESGLRADAVNPKNDDGYPDIGLAQIHVTSSDPFTVAEMKNPEANLAEAKYKFDHRGWQPWASSNSCHHMWKAGETK